MGKYDIAPLRPPTLATFRSWGNSAGAGRTNLPGAKIQLFSTPAKGGANYLFLFHLIQF